MSRNSIYSEIDSERDYQQQKWGDTVDDTLNTPWMWTSYVCLYASKWMAGTFLPLDRHVTDSFRKMMIKTATICVAAVESIDRQRALSGKAFFEK